MFLHLDCRFYKGDRPCKFARLCEGCPHYAPMGPRYLIIKLGALGDVVRTAALLGGLARLPEPPWITWLTAPAALPLVQRMPGVDRALAFTPENLIVLEQEHFDAILSLDKEPVPCAAAMRIPATERVGIGLSRYGTPMPLNDECDYYFRLGLDDDEKFHRNTKPMPQLLYEALGMEYRGDRYVIEPTAEDRMAARAALTAAGGAGEEAAGGRTALRVGINPGAGAVFAHKAWREEGYVELIAGLAARHGDLELMLLGGAAEAELNTRIAEAARTQLQAAGHAACAAAVLDPGAHHPLGVSAALVGLCDVVVSGDTLAMHLAIAQGRRVIAIFGPTCAQEIELYGLGEKIVTPIECSPCYRRTCDITPHCQDLIGTATVLAAVERQLEACRETALENS